LLRLLAYLVGNTTQLFFIAVSLYAALQVLNLPEKFERGGARAVSLLILLQLGLWAGRALRFYLEKKEAERGADRAFAGSLDIVKFIARVLIWSLLILVALENFGVNITALLAGLGVGGVAVALALQNVLGDLFASLSIALDKPFMIGDSLTIDTFVGRVEHIGIKTTRLRSESGEQIILANADIVKSRVRNYGAQSEQRVLTVIRAAYDTPAEKLKALPKLLENIVREQSVVRFERCHLRTLGESAFIYELSFFVQQPAVNSVLDIQQAVNFRIIDELRARGIDFAYPTQQLLVERRGEPPEK
jgi:small-conductance mechanosensitive channel